MAAIGSRNEPRVEEPHLGLPLTQDPDRTRSQQPAGDKRRSTFADINVPNHSPESDMTHPGSSPASTPTEKDSTPTITPLDLSISIGTRLREAREASNRSIADISAELRLEVKIIEALEADAFAQLPAPAFVRGYLRGYTKMLGIAPDLILRLYDHHGFEPPALIANIAQLTPMHSSATRRRIVIFVACSIAVGLGLLVLWWWQNPNFKGLELENISDLQNDPLSDIGLHPSLPPPPQSPATTSNPDKRSDGSDGSAVTTAHESPAAAATAKPETDTGSPPSLPADNQTIDAAAAGAEPTSPPEITADAEAVDSGAANPESTPVEADIGSNPGRADPQIAPGALAAAVDTETLGGPAPTSDIPDDEPRLVVPTPPTASETPSARLVLAFADESWVEIYDRERTRVFSGLAESGRVLALAGVPPFDVLLGRPEGVQVTFDGQSFDYTPYIRESGIARFDIGATGDPDAAISTAPSQP